jgi:pimeloyl-ACP methyl ester carboxylesterase
MEAYTTPDGLTHKMALMTPDLRLHYVTAGEGDRTIVLLHGFPQTWKSWRRTIPYCRRSSSHRARLSRGRQHLSPCRGYDKRTMAADIHTLLREHVEIRRSVIMVGHDIGLMVAYRTLDTRRKSQAIRGRFARLPGRKSPPDVEMRPTGPSSH